MATLRDVEIGQRFSFEVYPSSILGNDFNNVILDATLSSRGALREGVDIAALHQNIYPSLPAGSVNDPSQYSYIRILLANGEPQVLGVPWIRPDSIKLFVASTINLTWQNATQEQYDKIMQALSANNLSPDASSIERS